MEVKYLLPLISTLFALIGIRKFNSLKWARCKNSVKLTNKVAIVTGANSGIGYEVAKDLAARNAHVVIACRRLETAKCTIICLEKQLKRKLRLTAMEIDLGSLKSIKQFAESVQERFPKIHLLINNGGVVYPKNEKHVTVDGLETHFEVNYLSHFYLTNLLLNTLKYSAPSRVINVVSTRHQKGSLDVDCIEKSFMPGQDLYANSKLALVYFCVELAKRVRNTGVTVYGVCPGWVYTRLFRHSLRWFHVFVAPIAFLFMRTPKQGAQTVISCATEPCLQEENGLLYRDCKFYPLKVEVDEDVVTKLWNKSSKMIVEKTM